MQKGEERFSSRIAFLMLSAGCAIGLGNVWRFPFIVGRNGGGMFVLLYLVCLALVGLPALLMEFAIGRASRSTLVNSAAVLTPERPAWRAQGVFALIGCFIMLTMYPVVTSWLLLYACGYLSGSFAELSAAGLSGSFARLTANPWPQLLVTTLAVWAAAGVCQLGLNRGVSRLNNCLMAALLVFVLVMAVNSLRLPGAWQGVKCYLLPQAAAGESWLRIAAVVDALTHAFFSLSVGVGCMAVFGSRIGTERTLGGEAALVCALDTLVALLSGLIIIPACVACAVEMDQGPGLVFVTLPHVFARLAGGRWWAALFFLMLSLAAFTTLLAVVEAVVAMVQDWTRWSRRRTVLTLALVLPLLALPCGLGFNVLKGLEPLGPGSTLMDLVDFAFSDFVLPLGALATVFYCTRSWGWGWDRFLAAANQGAGWRFPGWLRGYCRWVLPALILVIFALGLVDRLWGD